MKKIVKIILLIILVLGSVTAILFWRINETIKKNEADIAKTGKLDEKIIKLFPIHISIENYEYEPGTIDWGNDYLILKKQYAEESSVVYDTEWNTALGTEANYPGTSSKGVIVSAPYLEVVGDYENSFGKKVGSASKHNNILYYLDVDKKAVVAIDTVFGEEPPQNSNSNSGHDVGKPPSIEEVIKSVKNRLH